MVFSVTDHSPGVTDLSPTGISSPKDLINYFKQVEGKGIVSGENIETGDPASITVDPLATIQSETGL